ncbi:MAG TPA: hypothetical protein VK638_27480 [Edaphobacter sp.]|nr:hypothetical protein [Edaphobacter sp.]
MPTDYAIAGHRVSVIRIETAVTVPTIAASLGMRTSLTRLRDWGGNEEKPAFPELAPEQA